MKLFVDMDGVLTDFDKQAGELFGVPTEEAQDYMSKKSKLAWYKIDKAGKDYWAKMEWLPDGKHLWESIAIYRPKLLSSPSNHPSSHSGKKEWVGNELGDVPLILEQKKEKHVTGKDCVLIDDREKNVNAWKKAGGTGILHKNTKDTLEELSEFMATYKESSLQVVEALDSIASELESKGRIKEATSIDAVSNTIEVLAKVKARNRPSPIFDSKNPKVKDNKDHFPIDTIGRARNALARANQYSSSPGWYDGSLESLKETVARAVHAKYPSIEISEKATD